MPKARKSNREARKQPQKTLMEKRAAKKSKDNGKAVASIENAVRRPSPAPATKRA